MRRPIEYVRIYRDVCGTWGNCPCETSRQEKGFGTISTCGNPSMFTRSSRSDYFVSHENNFVTAQKMLGNTAYPFLMSVSHSPGSINPAGANSNKSAIGTRATLSVSLMDAASDDFYQDPYYVQRLDGSARQDGIGYQPNERGTFFGKYFQRNAYLWGRRIDWVTGEVDEDGSIHNAITRTFVISGTSGPNDTGAVTITAKDYLSLTNVEKAQAPKVSEGKLSADITDSDTSLTLSPAGVGVTYPTSGRVKVGKECMSYIGKSGDTLTGLTRGIDGSEQEEHKQDDTVQLAWVVDNKQPNEIIEELLTDFTNIPIELLDTAQWAQEVSLRPWLQHAYSAKIYEPTGVDKLLGDIAQQQQFTPYVDERENKIKIAGISPTFAPDESVTYLDDSANTLAGSVSEKDLSDQTITRVYTHVNVINWAEKLDDAKNYSSTLANWNPDEEDDNHLRQFLSAEVFGYWLTPTLGALLGQNVVKQFAKSPKQIDFKLDAKDNQLRLSDFITIRNRLFVDAYGQPIPRLAQIVKVNESRKATTWDVSAVAYDQVIEVLDQPWLVPIPVSMNNVNLRQLFDSTFNNYDPALIQAGKQIIFYPSSSNIVLGGDWNFTPLSGWMKAPAVEVGNWPVSMQAELHFYGSGFGNPTSGLILAGMGGEASGSVVKGVTRLWPGNGGDALHVGATPITLHGEFTIAGGGGGSFGAIVFLNLSRTRAAILSGNGGAGAPAGLGGSNGSLNTLTNLGALINSVPKPEYDGHSGALLFGGQRVTLPAAGSRPAGYSGAGGALGQSPEFGVSVTTSAGGFDAVPSSQSVMQGGKSVVGMNKVILAPDANVTFIGAQIQ